MLSHIMVPKRDDPSENIFVFFPRKRKFPEDD